MKTWFLPVKAAVVCFAIVLSTSCGQGRGLPEINGVKGPFFNVLDGKLSITMKFLNLNGIDAGAKFPLGIVHGDLQDSAIEFAPNFEDGGMMLTVYADADDLANMNIGVGDANTLPDGRPVPGIPGGELKDSLRVDAQFPISGKVWDMSFFFHKKFFGFWMPFGFETAQISGYWNVWIKEKNVGFLGLVGNEESTGRKAGGVLLLRLENLKNQQFQRLIEKSKRNPHLVF